MDTIRSDWAAQPFAVAFAWDPELGVQLCSVSGGRLLVNGSLWYIDGIEFQGDADVYLVADGFGSGSDSPHLSTTPGTNFSHKIVSVKNGALVYHDTTALCVGYPELQERDQHIIVGMARDAEGIEYTPLGADNPTPRAGGGCKWCRKHGVSLSGMLAAVEEKKSSVEGKINRIKQHLGID